MQAERGEPFNLYYECSLDPLCQELHVTSLPPESPYPSPAPDYDISAGLYWGQPCHFHNPES